MISAVGINAFAAEATPKITVFGNDNSPVKASRDVRLSSFGGSDKGMTVDFDPKKTPSVTSSKSKSKTGEQVQKRQKGQYGRLDTVEIVIFTDKNPFCR